MIAQVAPHCVAYLGAISDKLYLDPLYARKAAEKHGLSPAHFNVIWAAVENGIAIADRERHVSFYLFDEAARRWFQVSIKCASDTKKLYLATFHRITERKVISRQNKFGTLPK